MSYNHFQKAASLQSLTLPRCSYGDFLQMILFKQLVTYIQYKGLT